MGLNVLITNSGLGGRSGTNLYVRDLALELQRRGHQPSVYVLGWGEIADELRSAGIPVRTTLSKAASKPDIIHGHHFHVTLDAIQRLHTVPAIYICHDHVSPFDRPPQHSLVHRYFGVSQVCVDRLIGDGIPFQQTTLLFNFVDMQRFLPRPPLPSRPRKALVFSNYARESSHLPAVREACRQRDIELSVIGDLAGRLEAFPERFLGQYDLVFAKAKSAMEAMAVGTAVVLCDFAGVGPLVSSAKLETLRPLNFGFQALTKPLRSEYLVREIDRYDAIDAARVRDWIRTTADLHSAVDRLTEIYQEVIAEEHRLNTRARIVTPPINPHIFRVKFGYAGIRLWLRIPTSWRNRLGQWRVVRFVYSVLVEKLK